MKFSLLGAAALAVVLSACGGGSGSGPSRTTPPVTTNSNSKSTTSISFTVPRLDNQASPSSTKRSPKFISPGQNGLTFILDGTKIFNNVAISSIANGSTTTSPDGNTTVVVTFTGSASGPYTYLLTITTLPGTHVIGAEILGNAPPIILSEAQASYTLVPGPNPAETLSLQGVLATGYIECDTAANIAANNNCAGSFTPNANTPGGSYSLTAIGADFDGFPIAYQSGVSFDNGGFSVYEEDTNGTVSITQNAPYTNPGTQLTGPSGGYYVPTNEQYGQPITVTCVKSGTTTLGLVNAQQGPSTPLTGETYAYFDPSNNFPTTGNYPGSGDLAVGSKTPGNPAYHGGNNPNAVTNLATVNCSSSFGLTIN